MDAFEGVVWIASIGMLWYALYLIGKVYLSCA